MGLERVRAGIRDAALAAGRDPSSIILVAVSKTFGPREIIPVINAGQRVFGENRVQEAKAKWPGIRSNTAGIELHLIGPLQSNKVADAVGLFDAIHTVDRAKIAQAVAAEMLRQKRHLKIFVQVNTGLEPQKAGVVPSQVSPFLRQCREEFGLQIEGLMCIPPLEDDPTAHFSLLCELARNNGILQLSMGMSGDYAEAISCGATHVRIGSAIFGHRQKLE